ncbi:ribosome biogenesis GTPase YlqF [Caldanaerobius polysaccharolyticus]|nr:ribosome biogenesis GTPase YlqF [Caldanaerobius polysaccharolyticus]
MIQWYPGHMAKTKKLIIENLKLVDVVLHIIDARVPRSSYNPLIEKLSGNKPQIVVMNKADLADDAASEIWIEYYRGKGIKAVKTNARNRKGIKDVLKAAKELTESKREKMARMGYVNVPIKFMIVGIPNVGKSAVINAMAGSAKAKVGNKPGITRGKQWIRIGGEFEYLDTPGILWPKFEDEMTGYMLAFVGSIKDEVLDFEEIALKLIGILSHRYPQALLESYQLNCLSEDPYANLLSIGEKRGCRVKGGEIDALKAARIVIDDFRNGRLGNITLELPEGVKYEQ